MFGKLVARVDVINILDKRERNLPRNSLTLYFKTFGERRGEFSVSVDLAGRTWKTVVTEEPDYRGQVILDTVLLFTAVVHRVHFRGYDRTGCPEFKSNFGNVFRVGRKICS